MSNSALPTSDVPLMSTPETLSNIFFEPGRTFDALRQRPRFLVAGLIIAALSTLFTIALFQKVDFNRFVREQMDKNPRTAQMTPEQKERALSIQQSGVMKGFRYASPIIAIAIFIAAGGALYMLGAMAMGGQLTYKQALAVWVYSSFPPLVLMMIANFLLLFLKSAEDLDPTQGGGNLARVNLSLLLAPEASPILKSALGAFDLFGLFGLILAAIGLRHVARLSTGAAWTVALGIWLLGLLTKVAWAASTGTAI